MQETFPTEQKWKGWQFWDRPRVLDTYDGTRGLQKFKNDVATIEYGKVKPGPPRDPMISWGFESIYITDKLWSEVDDIAQFFNVAQSTYPTMDRTSIDVRYDSGASFGRTYVSVIVPRGPVRLWHWWQSEDMFKDRKSRRAPMDGWD